MPDIVGDIKRMKIRGARQIALESLTHLKRFSEKNGFGHRFEDECRRLISARPTAAMPYNVIHEVMKNKSPEKIDELLSRIEHSIEDISKTGKKLFKKKTVVITHCHSHEAISLLIASKRKISKVYVTETRPRMQGIETARDLSKHIPTYFIVDSASGYYMPEVDMLIIGADALRREGVVNKIGTLMMAMTAGGFGKPVYVVSDTMKIDRRRKIIIEKRDCDELCSIKNVKIENPAFDVTPWKYVTAVITERGIFSPKAVKRMIG